ncbi:MAG TPA: acylase [Vicinamibacteria bacterium]|nr:acylase [Vicinamibacteria bacterium]
MNRVLLLAGALVVLAPLALLRSGGPTPKPCGCAAPDPGPANPNAEILWDAYGVPHIFARDTESLFHAYGWAQMEAHGDLVLLLYGQARGRAAEYWGKDYLDSDKWVLRMGVPARAESWLAQQTPEWRRYFDAFARGMNDYAEKHGDRLDARRRVVLPVRPVDVLAHTQRVLHFTFVVSAPEAEAVGKHFKGDKPGSNAWAIAPSRSASGKTLLLANPHLPWSDLFTWFEAHLNAPGVNATGATLVGQNLLGIAFNDHLGWTHTVNTLDAADFYELTLAPGGYRFDGQVRPFETESHSLKIRQDDGSLASETLVVKKSVHGPVVEEKPGKALALRVAGIDEAHLAEQYWRMIQAQSLAEFETALRMLQMPMFTVMYGDRDGHVLHLFGGRIPVRPAGSYDWAGIVPGDTSATLWTNTHPYEDLPRVADPPSGWLQNANDPPWTTTFPSALDPGRFPPYMAPRSMELRPQRSARMLAEDDKVTFDELVADAQSTRMELADRVLDDLVVAVERHGDDTARRAITTLVHWDRLADNDSQGAVLFAEWVRTLAGGAAYDDPSFFAVPWDEKRPRETPDGLRDPKAAADALSRAALAVEKSWGHLDVPWGDVYRLRRDSVDLPANGGSGSLGIFRVTGYQKAKDGRYSAVGGDSYVAAIEFATPVRARALLGYGNWSQPGSKHRTDQLELYSKKELRPVWRTRAEVEAHLEKREAF